MFSNYIINRYNINYYKLIKLPLYNKKRWKPNKINDKKLLHNIIRAKNTIFELIMCNDFYWFFTGTMSHDRDNLDYLIKHTNQIIRDCRKKFGGSWNYIFIPEKHKKGGWHIHGVLTYDFIKDFYINKNYYLSWFSFDKIGFISASRIDDKLKSAKYITKYISKHMSVRNINERLYFCSQNLKRKSRIRDLVGYDGLNINFDKTNNYCSIKDLNLDELLDISNNILNVEFLDIST